VLPVIVPGRREFGLDRSACGCATCVRHCRYVSGYLVPSDLGRLVPPGADPFAWAESNLRASPGALVGDSGTGRHWRIPTLVPAVRADGSCIHLDDAGRCAIHAVAPFGCAFFDCRVIDDRAPRTAAILAIAAVHRDPASLYRRLVVHLAGLVLVVDPPEARKTRMWEAARLEDAPALA
jgi:hypothetical protein